MSVYSKISLGNHLVDRANENQVALVWKGFAILAIAHVFLGPLLLKPLLALIFPDASPKSLSLLSSSAFSPIVASCYLFAKTRLVPRIIFNKEMLYAVLAGIVSSWLIIFIVVLAWGEKNHPLDEMLRNPSVNNVLSFFLFILWVPLIEEILHRGFILEILRTRWSNTSALLFSSLLFTFPHLLYPELLAALQWLLFFGVLHFIQSMILGMVYLRGGLIAAFLVHAFRNL